MCRVVRSGGTLGFTTSPGWWWEADPRWQWHAELLDRLGIVSDLLPSSGQQRVAELLVTAPVSNIESNDVVLQIEWDTSETYWQWCWSHGWRAVMERLTENQLLEYRRGVEEAIGSVRPIEGQILANLTTASRR